MGVVSSCCPTSWEAEIVLQPGTGRSDAENLRMKVAEHNRQMSEKLPVSLTVSVAPEECTKTPPLAFGSTNLTFGDWTTTDAVLHYCKGAHRVCALNFANGVSTGGGYLGGAPSQEADLCRRIPCLHASLEEADRYGLYPFGPNTLPKDYYSYVFSTPEHKYAHVLFTPDLQVMRASESKRFELEKGSKARRISIISAAAPNIPAGEVTDKDLLYKAIRSIFIAPKLKDPTVDTLILGAWGCGAFRGDPHMFSELFARALREDLGKLYAEVHFAIPSFSAHDRNAQIFMKTFKRHKLPFTVIN